MRKVIRILLYQTRARNCLPTARRAVNGLKSSTPINLCLRRAKLSKLKLEEGPPEAGGSSSEMKIKKTPLRGASTSRKRSGAAREKIATAAKGKVSMPAEAGQTVAPLDEQTRIRAYFISERRRRFALPGDADSDWLEAKRQLLSESGPR